MTNGANIITPDLNNSAVSGYAGYAALPTRVKFEVRSYDPNAPQPKKRGILSKIFGAFGNILKGVAPIGFLFGPAGIIAGAGAAGIGGAISNAAAKRDQPQGPAYQPLPVGYPGLDMGIGGLRENVLYSSSRGIR